MKYIVKTFAKINLSLIVYARLKNNYHPICSIFQNISLFDQLIIKIIEKGKFILTSNNSNLPVDEKNILTKIYLEYKKLIPFGLKIHIDKNIPLGGGMGGASSNAAALLSFLNEAAGWYKNKNSLARIGAKFGADVPFFIFGGTALVRGIGQKVYQIPVIKYKYFVLIDAQISIDTKTIYQKFDLLFPNIKKPGPTPKRILRNYIGENSLTPVVFSKYPKLQEIETKLEKVDAPKLHLSGSGATVFLAFKQLKEANKWYLMVSQIFPNYKINIVKSVSKGFEI